MQRWLNRNDQQAIWDALFARFKRAKKWKRGTIMLQIIGMVMG